MSVTKRLAIPTLVLAIVYAAGGPAFGDAPKAARGIVTSIGGSSIMINLPTDVDIRFRVDESTKVVARGAGRKMRQAQADGATGVRLGDVLPIGATVEVRYEERAGQRYAREIVSLASNRR